MSLFNTFSLYLDPFGHININEDLIINYEINIKRFVYITCINYKMCKIFYIYKLISCKDSKLLFHEYFY